jgi:hypothetical protein
MAWRQWKFWSGVHKAEKVLRDFGVKSLRCATRQWVFNLWCTVCSATIAAIAKATADEEAALEVAAAETEKMAAMVEAAADRGAAMCRCMRVVAEFQWKGPRHMRNSGRGSKYVAAWYHKYMTDWYAKDGYGCH